MDVVATALQEMVDSGERALHVVSPCPVPWNTVFLPIGECLGVPAVPYDEWVARLEEAARAASELAGVEKHDAAFNLIGFFKSAGMGGAAVPLSTAKAVKASKALANVRPIGREDALNYVRYWKQVGYLDI